MLRRNQAISLHQATLESPTLARLTELALESNSRLRALAPLIPPPMRSAVKAGPIDGATWCLLAQNASVAAKLRQLLPEFQSRLLGSGHDVKTIRVKIQKG